MLVKARFTHHVAKMLFNAIKEITGELPLPEDTFGTDNPNGQFVSLCITDGIDTILNMQKNNRNYREKHLFDKTVMDYFILLEPESDAISTDHIPKNTILVRYLDGIAYLVKELASGLKNLESEEVVLWSVELSPHGEFAKD